MSEKKYYIEKINRVIDEIGDTWKSLNTAELANMKDSWDDPLCEEYVSKFRNLDKLVGNMMDQLNDIRICWENYNEKETKEQQKQ